MAVRITGAGVALTVGIIVVTGLIIGGLFYARQSGEQARRNEATQIAKENQEQKEGEDVALNEGDTSNGSENESENSGENSNANENGTDTSGSESGAENSASNGSESTQNTGNGESMPTTGSSADEAETVQELPRTGGGDIFAHLAVIGGLTFAISAYVVSREKLRGVL